MSNYSKKEALKVIKEKYKICLQLKEFDRAKKWLDKIRELESEDKNGN